jgi:hypothetical protein
MGKIYLLHAESSALIFPTSSVIGKNVQRVHSACFTAGWLIFKIFAIVESSAKIISQGLSHWQNLFPADWVISKNYNPHASYGLKTSQKTRIFSQWLEYLLTFISHELSVR